MLNKILYHIFNVRGYDRTVQTEPNYKIGEHVVAVRITIPDEVFQRRPIPVIDLVLKAPQIGAADVIVDSEPVRVAADEAGLKQLKLQEEFALLFQAARQSADPAMRQVAEAALTTLLEAGVDVRISTEEAEWREE